MQLVRDDQQDIRADSCLAGAGGCGARQRREGGSASERVHKQPDGAAWPAGGLPLAPSAEGGRAPRGAGRERIRELRTGYNIRRL